jgi:hypothetical protein
MHGWVNDFDQFVDFLAYVMVCAPDQFFKEDYLEDHEQLDLDKAFDELRGGLRFVDARISDKRVVRRVRELIDEAYRGFRVSRRDGARRLQEADMLVAPYYPTR